MVPMIIFDSNIWIFGEVSNAPEHQAAVKGYETALKRETIGINAIVVSEVFHKLSRLFDTDTAYLRLSNILQNPSIEWLDLDRTTAANGMRLAKNYGLRINDALIAAQAIDFGAKLFTDDGDFERIKELEVIPLR
jgi:predicted nucleic acid-binding protein